MRFIHTRPLTLSLGLILSLGACGGGDGSTSPSAAPTPTPDPRLQLAPGPVQRVLAKVLSIDIDPANPGRTFREPFSEGPCTSPENCFVVLYPGEFVRFDAEQTNARGEQCQWRQDPAWSWNGVRVAPFADSPNGGALKNRDSSNPFVLRVDVMSPGDVVLQVQVDGISSNVVAVRVKRP